MIYTVTLNPALDKTAEIPGFVPNAVHRMRAVRTDPGGKGINVSKVIQKLGQTSTALGILAGNTGRFLADSLERMGIACCFTFVPGETRTNLKIIDPISGTHTDINEPGISVSGQVLEEMLAQLVSAICPGDIAVLSGSLPMDVPKNLYHTWVSALSKAGARVFLDAEGEALAAGLLGRPYLVKPNQKELELLVGKPLEQLEDILCAGEDLLCRGISRVVISLGEQGAIYFGNGKIYRCHGLCVPVGSTVGAGDAMVAALAVACAQNLEDTELLRLAIATSAANVMCSGTQAADFSAIEPLLPQVKIELLDRHL